MRFALFLLLAAFPAYAQEGAARKWEHLSPAGLPGSLLIVPDKGPTDVMLKRFIELAGGAEAANLVLVAHKDAAIEDLKKRIESTGAKLKVVVDPKDSDATALQNATGVWLLRKEDSDLWAWPERIRTSLNELRANRKVVAGARSALQSGGQLPACWMTFQGLTGGERKPLAIPLLQLGKEAGLLIQGRDMSAVGDGEVTFTLLERNGRPKREIELKAKNTFDYNELLRAARQRAEKDAYAPKDPGVPEVKSGALVIVGGGGMPADIAKRFIELGGGEEGNFVCLPTSMPDPVNMQAEGQFLKRMGAKNLVVLPGRELKDVEDPKNLEILKKATGIWFGGGRQWRFVDAYEGTKAYDLFHDVLKRGGVIGGSSAGATIQGDYLVRGAPAGPNIMMCEGYERAFRFLPGVGIDQHFTARNRFKDMTAFMKAYPQFLGIGLDEATAIVVKGTTAEIMGKGKVHFYDRRKPVEEGKPDYDAYPAGTKYDLKERKVVK